MERPSARPPAIPIEAPPDSLPASLPALLEALWLRLAEGVEDRWTAWALPALLTNGVDGVPQGRLLVLRGFDPDRRLFLFHADARSDKVIALTADPRASLLFWSPQDALEVRIAGRVTMHCGDAEARVSWRDASPLSRSAAAGDLPSGTQLYASTPFSELPGAADDSIALSRFVLMIFEARAIDWLWLGRRDLRRARFHWTGADWAGTWVVP